MAIFSDVINSVEVLLRQEVGPSVQQYSEDIIAKLLQDSFDRLFKNYWYPEYYNSGDTFTLDGTTGQVVEDLTAKIKRWDDIHFVWKSPYVNPLRRKPPGINPLMVSNYEPMWEPIGGAKVFRIYPTTHTGKVVVAYRTKPADFVASDTMLIDTKIMEAEAAMNYIIDDMTNQEAVKKFTKQMGDREGDLRVALGSGPRPQYNGRGGILTVWATSP